MNFEDILSRLGERGELGENPRQSSQSAWVNTGRMGANAEEIGEKFALFASPSPSSGTTLDKAIRPIRPVRTGVEEQTHEDAVNASPISAHSLARKNAPDAFLASWLGEDFKVVSTWWQWSTEDMADFQAWACQHQDEAAQWIHQEAEWARYYADTLICRNVEAFIGIGSNNSRSDPMRGTADETR